VGSDVIWGTAILELDQQRCGSKVVSHMTQLYTMHALKHYVCTYTLCTQPCSVWISYVYFI